MSKITISGYYGFDNFGDEAILFVLVDNLKKQGHEVTVFSKNPEETQKKYGVKTSQTFSFWGVIKTLLKTDTLISGGGSLLQDVTSKKSLIYYLFVIFAAELLRKNVVIFAQGIGPINDKLLNFLTKKALRKAKYISVRDDKSLFLLRSWGLAPELVSDPVWCINTKTAEEKEYIGVQLRQWQNLSDTFLTEFAKAILKEFPQEKIKLFSFQNSFDMPVCERFKLILLEQNPAQEVEIVKNDSIEQIVYELSTCKTVAVMRYHALLLALKLGIKAFALCYDVKVKSLAEKYNVPNCLVNDITALKEEFPKLSGEAQEKTDKTFSFDEINRVL